MGKLIQYCTKASKFDGEWKWQAAGMGYIIETENKHYIVIDGGYDKEDSENIISIIEEMSGEKAKVDLWILTHPHADHYRALTYICEDSSLLSKIDIASVCCSIPESFTWKHGSSVRDLSADIKYIKNSLDSANIKITEPDSGDVINIDETLIKIFFTYKDASVLSDPNELSMVFAVYGKKKSAMFVGDAYENGLSCVYKKYRDEKDSLSCDIIQLAHHGLNGGYTHFYKEVGASIALVPISVSGDRAMHVPEELCAHHNFYAQNIASSVIKAYTGTVTIDF